jgi:hypothetical protein
MSNINSTETHKNAMPFEDQSKYTRALWEWTNRQLLQARRRSEEEYRRSSGYSPRRHRNPHQHTPNAAPSVS